MTETRPRLLISTWHSVFRSDGTIARVKKVISVLEEHYDVHTITMANRSEIPPSLDKLKIHVVSPSPPRTFAKVFIWLPKIASYLAGTKFDVIICENDWHGFLAHYLMSRIRGHRILFDAHGMISRDSASSGDELLARWLNRRLERFCISNSDYVIVVSEEILEAYAKYNRRIECIPVFQKCPEIVAGRIHDKGSQERERKIGVIGPFDSKRNRQALEYVQRSIDDFSSSIRFVVIGDCGERIDHPRISYTGYIESDQKYLETVSSLDAVLVLEKISTSGPLTKILEPMSRGIPVYTTPLGTIGLRHLESGKNIMISDEGGLADLINRTIFDDDQIERLRRESYSYVKEFYGYENASKKMGTILKTLI